MPLLNYTTSIAVDKTIAEIQKCLSTHGATGILTEYDQGVVIALSFGIKFPDRDLHFRLPCDHQPVLELLKKDRKVPRRLVSKEQALRVAWRIIKDWTEAQMAIVETKMVSIEQVFFPYAITNDGRTVFERVKNSPLLLSSGERASQ